MVVRKGERGLNSPKGRDLWDKGLFLSFPPAQLSSATMAGFEDSRPKTKARNFAPAGVILFQFQKSLRLIHDSQFFEPWRQRFLEEE